MREDKKLKAWNKEKELIPVMIKKYCHGKHGTKGKEMCQECQKLTEYALFRLEKCPFKVDKKFCSFCKIHCYKPDMREKIKAVMKYSGPRMLFSHPIFAISHVVQMIKYTFSDGSEANGVAFDGGKFSARCVSALSSGVVRICFNVTMNDFNGDFGLTFGLKGSLDNRLGAAVIAFDPVNSSLTCYNDVSNILRYGSALAKVGFAYSTGKSYKVEALIDGEIVTVYLDGCVALTARIPDMDGNNFSFYSNGVSVKFSEICYYE